MTPPSTGNHCGSYVYSTVFLQSSAIIPLLHVEVFDRLACKCCLAAREGGAQWNSIFSEDSCAWARSAETTTCHRYRSGHSLAVAMRKPTRKFDGSLVSGAVIAAVVVKSRASGRLSPWLNGRNGMSRIPRSVPRRAGSMRCRRGLDFGSEPGTLGAGTCCRSGEERVPICRRGIVQVRRSLTVPMTPSPV
jgi:hypothetical protein